MIMIYYKLDSSIQKCVSGNQQIGCNAIVESFKFGQNNFNADKTRLTFYASNKNGALALIKSMQDELPVHVFSKAIRSKQQSQQPQMYTYHGIFKVKSGHLCNDNNPAIVSAMSEQSEKTKRGKSKMIAQLAGHGKDKVDFYEFTLQVDR